MAVANDQKIDAEPLKGESLEKFWLKNRSSFDRHRSSILKIDRDDSQPNHLTEDKVNKMISDRFK